MSDVIENTKQWISKFVIGLNLCPFAEKVYKQNRIRFMEDPADCFEKFHSALMGELQLLVEGDRNVVETSFLVFPFVTGNFFEFNDWLERSKQLLKKQNKQQSVQFIGFHPCFQFADSMPDEVGNYTNRSPYPMVHLLRDISISELGAREQDLLAIPIRNKELLEKMGLDHVKALCKIF